MDELQPSYSGRWWLPDQPDISVGGTLTFEGDFAAKLALQGSLPQRLLETRFFSQWDVIQGETVDGGRITLLQCFETSRKTRMPGGQYYQEVTTLNVLVGNPVEPVRPEADGISFELSDLAAWASPLRLPFTEAGDEDELIVKYRHVPPQLVTLRDDINLSLNWEVGYSSGSSTATLEERCCLRATLSEPWHLNKLFVEIVTPMQHLLTFATLSANRPRHVVLPGAPLAEDRPDDFPRSDVRLIRSESDKPPEGAGGRTGFYQMLFSLNSAPMDFGTLATRWWDLLQRLGRMIDLYLGVTYYPPKYSENAFLNMCQAVEGYHRATVDRTRLDPESYGELRRSLQVACPPEHLPWLNGWLSHGNEPSFKDRVDDLIAKAGRAVSPLIETRPKYSRDLRDNRDDLAHWLTTDVPSDTYGEKIYDLTRVTRFLIAACLLLDLGWSEEQAAESLSRTQAFDAAVREGRMANG